MMLETLSPVEDYERATEYLNSALKYYKNNSISLVLMLFFADWYLGGLNQILVELLEVVNIIRDSLTNLGYQELSELYDLHDTVFEWHELNGVDEVNRRLILKGSYFY